MLAAGDRHFGVRNLCQKIKTLHLCTWELLISLVHFYSLFTRSLGNSPCFLVNGVFAIAFPSLRREKYLDKISGEFIFILLII